MVEILDNTIQFCLLTFCTVWAATIALRRKSQTYAILTCFYGTFALGCLYWLAYLLMMTYTPKIFYVSDLSWMASFLFLLILELSLCTPPMKSFRAPIALLIPLVIIGLTIYFCVRWGDYIITIGWGGLMAACGYYAMRGLLYACRQTGDAHKYIFLHCVVLFIITAEHLLWLLSPFCKSDAVNPYFWCDLVLTAGLVVLLPAMKKAVDR